MEPNHIIVAHSSHINRVLFSQDDQMLFSFGFNGELKAWDRADWSLIRSYEGHTETVNCGVQLGENLISVSRDRTINFFEIDTGKLFHTVSDHKKGVGHVSKTVNEQYLITSGQDLMAVTRNTDGSMINSLKPSGKNLGVLTTTPDSKYVFVGGYSNDLQVFTIPELETVVRFEACNIAMTSMRCHPDKAMAWGLDYSGHLNLIDTAKWELTEVVNLNRKGVMGMSFAKGRNELAFTADKAVILLDAETLEEKAVLKSSAKGNYGISYSHDEKVLALASADKRIRIWELD